MKLVVAEKNIAAQKSAQLLADAGAPKNDKVYNTQVYRFKVDGEDWVSMGLAGHILAPDFPDEILFDKKMGWYSLTEDGEVLPAGVPDGLARPPYDTKRKPFLANGINIKGWKVESLPYLTWSPIIKNPAEKEIIRVLKNLAKKADEVIIATDFDREGELIGSDALNMIREVAPELPARRARYSALIKGEVTEAFANLVELDQDLADAGESRQYIDLIWGAVLTRYLTLAKFGGFGNVRSAGRVQTPTLALVVERERERMAFVPEDYWQIRGLGEASGQEFKIAHTTARFTDKVAAEAAYAHVEGATTGTVTAVAKRSRKQQPPVPFNTTALQAAAAAEGISPARTMRIAESLYMSGFISYPRVDNTVYPKTLDIEGIVKGLASGTLRGEELNSVLEQTPMIAQTIAERTGSIGLITGESIGQVASQTLQSLAATNEVCTMPVFRPVIGFDKQEIVDVSEKIGTFETSIQPFEDCCTIFVAKHPVTKPNINVIHSSERRLEEKIDQLVETALETTEQILCQG